MRTISFYLMMLLMFVPLWGQAQEKLFHKYSDKNGVKSVYISKAMLEMGPHLFSNIYVGSASKHLNSVSLLSTSKKVVYNDMRKDIHALLESSKFELLMKQKGENTTSEFYITRSGSKIKELIMFTEDGVKEHPSLYFFRVVGTFFGSGEPAGFAVLERFGFVERTGIPQGFTEIL